jgi:uncharacterized protein YqgC (DUF456 family)
MLDTIRQLSRTVKLKDIVIHSFIPEDTAKVMERRAVWSAEDEAWTILKIELAGNVEKHIYIYIYMYIYKYYTSKYNTCIYIYV